MRVEVVSINIVSGDPFVYDTVTQCSKKTKVTKSRGLRFDVPT